MQLTHLVALLVAEGAAAFSLARPMAPHTSSLRAISMTSTEAPFESQLKQFAPPSDLPSIRNQVAQLESDLIEAVDTQDFAAAAMLRDDLAELRSKDPAVLASDLRERLEELVKHESYTEAATTRDQLMVLRRFQPQYQLAGLWKGNYPNHGEAYIKIHYEQDTLVAVKVTGDEHVPAGEVTFRADLTALYTEQSSSFEAPDEDLVGVRVEVVSVGSDGTSQPQEVERYKGAGRIAARGFQYAHFVPGQLFLMDTDVIGFLWLQLGTFVVFNRVSDEPPDDADDYGYAAA